MRVGRAIGDRTSFVFHARLPKLSYLCLLEVSNYHERRPKLMESHFRFVHYQESARNLIYLFKA